MPSKYQFSDSRLYLPGTDIPFNKLNIVNAEILHTLEQVLLEEAYEIFLDEMKEETCFDEKYFKSLHERTFNSLYDWAGRYRDFNMAKGESRFCQGAYVDSESKKIFDAMAKENFLRNFLGNKEKFAERLAYYKCELIALHPFYELNGRITRMFFDMIAAYNGYRFIDYSACTPKVYIDAAIECVQFADCSKMEKIIRDGLQK